jgi:catechol 2,3-dioxygenase-like lactoylglutathione lyase family enzyme
MAPAAVHHLGHVALRVQDMERAKAFYVSLGLQLCWDAPDWAYLQWPGAVHAQLLAAGRSCGPVHDHRDGTASFYLQDPEGNWLEMLYEPPGGIPSNLPG